LRRRLEEWAGREWRDPVRETVLRLGLSTIERWYYRCRHSRQPLVELTRRRRRDRGRCGALPAVAQERLVQQYQQFPQWSMRLHVDSLWVWWRGQEALRGVAMASARTVQRFLGQRGLVRRRGGPAPGIATQEAERTRARQARLETRSYRVTHAHGLWHVDFHHARRRVRDDHGALVTPVLLAFIDDHTRFVAHAQWYACENTQAVVHGFMQAVQRAALPRVLLSDNGKPFVAAEFTQGLARLGVMTQRTLSYSPQQNGKIEVLWAQVEGRLMAQLVHQRDLDLYRLNVLTQAWLIRDYHQRLHEGLDQTPVACLQQAPQAGRSAPEPAEMEAAFTRKLRRRQRRSDGTVLVGRQRFEVPSRYRHLLVLVLRQASWCPSVLYLADADSDTVLCRLPLWDPAANACRPRHALEAIALPNQEPMAMAVPAAPPQGLPPLVADWATALAESGLPPPFLPLDNRPRQQETER
jgi:transposase InsO family protein